MVHPTPEYTRLRAADNITVETFINNKSLNNTMIKSLSDGFECPVTSLSLKEGKEEAGRMGDDCQ